MINRFTSRFKAISWARKNNLTLYTVRCKEGYYKVYRPITECAFRIVYERHPEAQRIGRFKSRYYASKWAEHYGIDDYCIVSYRIPGDDGLSTLMRYTIYVPAFSGISTDVYIRLLKEMRDD